MKEDIFKFGHFNEKTWLIITNEGKYILTIPPVNSIGWILVGLGAGIICLGIFLIVFTTKGIK